MNGIAEGVRQLPGTSVNQVPDVERVLVTAGTAVPTSGLILGCVIDASATNPKVTRSSIDVCRHTIGGRIQISSSITCETIF
jgi:hypothetical protein